MLFPDDLSGGVDGDLIDYEDDGYVAPNMSYVPEGLDEHEVSVMGGGGGGGNNDDILLKVGEDEEDTLEVNDTESVLPDGKIGSLPFLGLRQGGGRGGAIQGKEGIKFCSVAIVQKPVRPNT